MLRQAVLGALPLLAAVKAASYARVESFSGTSFFDGFDYPAATYDNTTNGDVFWATADNTSLIYTDSNGVAIMKVDNTSDVVYNEKRYAPKLLAKTAYDAGTVWVIDMLHAPWGCSVWPAVWTQGSDWPNNGEIDIFEGVNDRTINQVALHTNVSTCTASNGGTSMTGVYGWTDCSVDSNDNSGCITNSTSTASYGAGFAAAGGGVYVAEYTDSAIMVWFLTRSDVPSNLTVDSTSIDTSTLGTPLAVYSDSSCSISDNFGPQTLTIDITLCGDWAGASTVLEETCPTLTGSNTCYTTYVVGDGSTTYENAYFAFNYINVFSSSNSSSSSSSSSTSSGAAQRTSDPIWLAASVLLFGAMLSWAM